MTITNPGGNAVGTDTSHSAIEVSDEQLKSMSREELARLGAKMDGVDLVEYGIRYEPGSPADKRAERGVSAWFLLTGLFALLFTGIFLFWPYEYQTAYSETQWVYSLYTPLIGITLGASLLFLGIGVVALAKKITPHEVAVQTRHDGFSREVDRKTLSGEVFDVVDKTGLVKRRGVLKGSLALAGGGLGLAATVGALGGFIKNPWSEGPDSQLWVTPWAPMADGTKIRLTQQDGTPVRPEDLEAGGMATVYPGIAGGAKFSDAPVMLFRVRPNQAISIRTGQEGFEFGDYYAYSKICTHVGCPVSLYEQQTGRVLCPCHQSQFDLFDGMRPVFGPAARPLPQLPIELDSEGYFVATSDFIEAVGPGFWENGKYPAWGSSPKEKS